MEYIIAFLFLVLWTIFSIMGITLTTLCNSINKSDDTKWYDYVIFFPGYVIIWVTEAFKK